MVLSWLRSRPVLTAAVTSAITSSCLPFVFTYPVVQASIPKIRGKPFTREVISSSPRRSHSAMVTSSASSSHDGGTPNSNGRLQNGPRAPSITILHFNDVYNVEEQPTEPKAGAARFKTALQSFNDRQPLILFSGDILAPSIMSTFTHGEQMVPVMNQLGIHCAVYGNHDFDFGLERLMDVVERTDFPWLMSNVDDNETERPLAEGAITHTINWQGWKIGIIGLVEEEWLATLATINPDEVTFHDYVDKGRELATQLRNEGCEYIIALTHMRTPNDTRLAENVDEIDLILGGHDHEYELKKVNDKIILKSGTDFREFSTVTITQEGEKYNIDIEKIVVDSKFEPDPNMVDALKEFEAVVSAKMDEPLGTLHTNLDGRFASIRTSETNLGNLVCDVMLAATNADIAILNSGTLRSDRIHDAGEFKVRDLMTILPMLDPLIVLEITGENFLQVLENGVSQYPKLEGRFPQVSGVHFVFDPTLPAGERILKDLVKIGDEYLQLDSKYRLVCKSYMHQGRDGYNVLSECEVLQDEEQCPMLCNAVQNHFEAIKTRQGQSKKRRNSTHRQSLVLLSRRAEVYQGHSLIRHDDEEITSISPHPASRGQLGRSSSTESALSIASNSSHGSHGSHSARESFRKCGRRGSLIKQDSVAELEEMACRLEPKIEGRIIVATDEKVESLRAKKLSHGVSVIEEEDEASTPGTPQKNIITTTP